MFKTIKLKTQVMIAGKIASPNDKNKGVYKLHKNVAGALVARNRAVYIEDVKEKNDNKQTQDKTALEEAKKTADKLGIKYNPNIGLAKLLEKIEAKKAETAGNNKGTDEQAKDPQKLDKLKVIADEADIEYKEDIEAEELENILIVELEKYASEIKAEIPTESDIFTTWELIKEKLANENN